MALGLLAAWVLLADAGSAEKVDANNWREHPDIVLVRDLVAEADAGLNDKAWSKRSSDVGCAGLSASATLWRDAQKRPRRFIAQFGSGDSAYTVTATYDATGTLRFVLVKAGAVNHSKIEQRTWFDADGAELWKRDDVKGPGYTWWRYDPKTKQLADAERAFKKGGCLGER